MANYAVVQDSDGLIVNMVVWDGVTTWSPPAGSTAVEDTEGVGKIDGNYTSNNFHDIMPKITGVEPSSGGVAGGTTITVTGYNLDYGTVDVKIDGVSATNITNRTKTSLQCDTPEHAGTGAVDVTVENENGSWVGQNSLTGGFTYS